jgi:hypothetical protein
VDTSFYLGEFQKAVDKLDKKLLGKKKIEVAVVLFGEDCVVLKLYKRQWTNPLQDPLTSESRIFFSVWISDSSMEERKILYNIHALKLRQLKGYSIQSRKFADIFRDSFKAFKHKWKNVSLQFGPQTLMEGWQKIDLRDFQDEILELANNFLEIEHLVDDTLAHFKQKNAGRKTTNH